MLIYTNIIQTKHRKTQPSSKTGGNDFKLNRDNNTLKCVLYTS